MELIIVKTLESLKKALDELDQKEEKSQDSKDETVSKKTERSAIPVRRQNSSRAD
jgi:hypothetical protein